MAAKPDFPQLREQAIALRRAGKSRREIKEILGVRNDDALSNLLRGEPPPPWTRRPRAKDDLHARACELRGQGLTYNEIAAELGVAKVRSRYGYGACRARSGAGTLQMA